MQDPELVLAAITAGGAQGSAALESLGTLGTWGQPCAGRFWHGSDVCSLRSWKRKGGRHMGMQVASGSKLIHEFRMQLWLYGVLLQEHI